jgi:hypothetical protein
MIEFVFTCKYFRRTALHRKADRAALLCSRVRGQSGKANNPSSKGKKQFSFL